MIQELINQFIKHFKESEIFSSAVIFSAVMSISGAAFYYLRTVPQWIWEKIERYIFFVVTIEETDELYFFLEKWFALHYPKSYRVVEASLIEKFDKIADYYESRNETQTDKIFYKHYEDSFMIFYKRTFLHILKGREKLENASDMRSIYFSKYRITSIFDKNITKKMLEDIRQWNTTLDNKNNISVFTNTTHGDWYEMKKISPKKVEHIALKDKEKIIMDIENYLKSKDWYIKRGIAYKRGYLFYGAPGNGKTALSLALAQKYNYNIYFISMGGLKDENLRYAFSELETGSILVIEDIDCIFDKRKSKEGITLSSLLNCLDGVFTKENTIYILTTNHPEKLDDALMREGRIDMKIEFANPEKKQVEEYLSIFYATEINLSEYNKNYSMAKVQDICLRNKENSQSAIKLLTKTSISNKTLEFSGNNQ